jgi:hypothetical protein
VVSIIVDHKAGKVVKAEPIVMPTLQDGHPIADVTLLRGADWKTVSEQLD